MCAGEGGVTEKSCTPEKVIGSPRSMQKPRQWMLWCCCRAVFLSHFFLWSLVIHPQTAGVLSVHQACFPRLLAIHLLQLIGAQSPGLAGAGAALPSSVPGAVLQQPPHRSPRLGAASSPCQRLKRCLLPSVTQARSPSSASCVAEPLPRSPTWRSTCKPIKCGLQGWGAPSPATPSRCRSWPWIPTSQRTRRTQVCCLGMACAGGRAVMWGVCASLCLHAGRRGDRSCVCCLHSSRGV